MTGKSPRRQAEQPTVGTARLPHARGLALPRYESDGAAGMDLTAALAADQPVRLAPGQRALIPTGLVLELPAGFEAQVRPRSGLALRHGITVLNSPGTIDCDYRGEVQVLICNLGQQTVTIERGQRIAQLVFQRVERVRLLQIARPSPTQRGTGGFGSTGATGRTAHKPSAAGGRKRTAKSSP